MPSMNSTSTASTFVALSRTAKAGRFQSDWVFIRRASSDKQNGCMINSLTISFMESYQASGEADRQAIYPGAALDRFYLFVVMTSYSASGKIGVSWPNRCL